MRSTRFVALLALSAAMHAHADEPPGKKVFAKVCAECHAPGFGHPGTQRLGWNRGLAYAVLEQRKDLSAQYIRLVVRHGLVEMPPFRPSELSDDDLTAITRYLARSK
jgi:mono/diheme cytochrome c family protein